MEVIKSVVTYVMANKVELISLITSIIGVASIIVKLTPTPKDDEILGKVKAIISKYIALN